MHKCKVFKSTAGGWWYRCTWHGCVFIGKTGTWRDAVTWAVFHWWAYDD